MKNKLFKLLISVCISAVLILAPANAAFAASSKPDSGAVKSTENAVIKNKNEVIYAILDSDGSTQAVYVINHFEVSGAGSVTDYGNYALVMNLTNTSPLALKKDAISFHSEKGNFYYQGNMVGPDLPWVFNISYYLDGVKTSPRDLAGKSGELEIRIATEQNEKVNPIFYENYMLQISITLDTEKCDNIATTDATIANAGKNRILAYTVMPGKDGDISLTATINDFTMGGIQVSALPFTMGIEMPDTTEMMEDMGLFSDAIDALNDGVKELNEGVSEMREGTDKLASGSADFTDGLSQLSDESPQIIEASSQIYNALSEISDSMADSKGGVDLGDFNQLPEGLAKLAQVLDDISGGLQELKNGYSAAYAALNSAIESIPDNEISESDINALYGAVTDPDQQAVLGQLADYYASARTVKGTYAQVQEAFRAVETSLDIMSGSIDTTAAALSGISAQADEALSGLDFAGQIQQLSEGISVLAENYEQFHEGLIQYTDGVGTLASGYSELDTGIVSLSNGTKELSEGTQELYRGTSELNDNVADLPVQMQEEIDKLMKDYDKSDFTPVSFVSEMNKNVSLVQFVFKTAEIKLEEKTITGESKVKEVTFWDRLLLLFKRGGN